MNSVGCPACAPAYVEKLKQTLAPSLPELCESCRRRYVENPLRMLDCKVDHDRMAAAPKLVEELCDECAAHLQQVLAVLDALGIPYEMDHTIVRGLDYYTKTAFEFQIEGIGAQSALGGGGRYDGLVEKCGGPPTPGVGLGMGLERALLARHGGDLARVIGFALSERPAGFAALAPEVLAAATAGDALARDLVTEGADYVVRALHALGWRAGEGLCLTGGLGPHYRAWLPPEVQASLAEARGGALDGAMVLAGLGAQAGAGR